MRAFPIRVDKKVVVITGGYGYLGSSIAESMALHGATVIVCGREKIKFDQAFSEQKDIHFVPADVSSTASISAAFAQISNHYSRIDVLINNAFFSKGQSPETLSDEDWDFGINGSLGSVFKCIREIIPFFKNQGNGKIINVSSMYGIVAPDFDLYETSPAFLNPPHYGAAKAGIIQLTKYYASYLGPMNIQVNAVVPGPYPSPAVHKDSDFIRKLEAKTCLGRIGRPADVAGAFVFLASTAADFITGQSIIIDGGWTIK